MSTLPAVTPALSSKKGAAKTILAVAETAPAYAKDQIEIFTAPFKDKPLVRRVKQPKSVAIAPNDALIVGTFNYQLLVYDAPWTGRPHNEGLTSPDGQFVFDTKNRLFTPDVFGDVYVFDAPYHQAPAMQFTPPGGGVLQIALDKDDNLFYTPRISPYVVAECRPPSYSQCKTLKLSNGALAVDQSQNLFIAVGIGKIKELPPPYRRTGAQVSNTLTAASFLSDDGALFVSGYNNQSQPALGVFVRPFKKAIQRVPVTVDYYPLYEFAVAQNHDLFASTGTYSKPCVGVFPYPYDHSTQCIQPEYELRALAAR
ncbi:MAG TPA: hypothetical protein VHR97_07075 [Candidatus Baltobacteraceae bacterium]|nr:hypothetical protein [Candidatus Baltobacteraceae bacterium]